MSTSEIDLVASGLSWQNPPATIADGLAALGETVRKSEAIVSELSTELRQEHFENAIDMMNQFLALMTQEYTALVTANKRSEEQYEQRDKIQNELKALKATIESINPASRPDAANIAGELSKHLQSLQTAITSEIESLPSAAQLQANLATSSELQEAVAKIPTVEKIQEGLATLQDVKDFTFKLPSTDGLATSEQLSGVATKEQASEIIKKIPNTDGLAKSLELKNLATSQEVKEIESKIPSTAGLATEKQLEGVAKSEELKELATSTQLDGLKEQVNGLAENMPSLGGLATTVDMEDVNSEIKRLGDNLSDLATAQQVSAIEAKIPSTQDLQEGLATSSEVKSLEGAVSNIQPPSLEAIREDLVTGEQFSERIGELETSLEPLAEIRQDMVTQHQLDAKLTEVNTTLGPIAEIRKDMVTQDQLDEKLEEVNTALEPIAEIRENMATQDQLDAKQEEVNTALGQLPAKVVEHLLKSDNFKAAVRHPAPTSVGDLQRGLATQGLVERVPQLVRTALLSPSPDPESEQQPPSVVTVDAFESFKHEIRQEISNLPKGATVDEIRTEVATVHDINTFKEEMREMIKRIPVAAPAPATPIVSPAMFNTFKEEMRGMIQSIPVPAPAPTAPTVSLDMFDAFKTEMRDMMRGMIGDIPRGPSLDQIAALLQGTRPQQPQASTSSTPGAQAAHVSTTPSTSTSQPSTAAASTVQAASRSQTNIQLPDASGVRATNVRSTSSITFDSTHRGTAPIQLPLPRTSTAVQEPPQDPAASVQSLGPPVAGQKHNRPYSPTNERASQKSARTIDTTIEEPSSQEQATQRAVTAESTSRTSPPTANRFYLEIDVSTRGRVEDSCLDPVFKQLARNTWNDPQNYDDPRLDPNSWLGKVRTCRSRDEKQKLAAREQDYNADEYTSLPRCFIGEIQKKPCISEEGVQWTWDDHDLNLTCPPCETRHPDFKSHQCLKVKDWNIFVLLNPTAEDRDAQRKCDDKYRETPSGDVAPGASRSGPGPGPGAGGPGGAGSSGPGGPGGPTTSGSRRGQRSRGLSNVSAASFRPRRSQGGGTTRTTHEGRMPSISPTKAKLSIRQKLGLKSKASKTDIEARFEDMFAGPLQQGDAVLPMRPGTLSTSQSTTFGTSQAQAQAMDPSKSGKLQRSKSGNLLHYANPANLLHYAGRIFHPEVPDLTSESRVGLLASERNGGHANGHANGHSNGHSNEYSNERVSEHGNGQLDNHSNGHNGAIENDSSERDPLGAGIIIQGAPVSDRYRTL